MAQEDYLKVQDTKSGYYQSTNVLDLIKKSKLERLEEKKNTVIYVLSALLLLIVIVNIIIL